MANLSNQIKQFAASKLGKRVWARAYSYRKVGKKYFANISGGLVKKFTLSGSEQSCKSVIARWEKESSAGISASFDLDYIMPGDTEVTKKCRAGLGECWDLAYAALNEYGGLKTYWSNKSVTTRVWSSKLANNLADVDGGHILELKSVLAFRILYKEDSSSNINAWEVEEVDFPDTHTAIVKKKINRKQGTVKVYQQNFDGKKVVHESTLPLFNAKYTQGKYQVLQISGKEKDIKSFLTKSNSITLTTSSGQATCKSLINKMGNHIEKTKNFIPDNIKIFIPQS